MNDDEINEWLDQFQMPCNVAAAKAIRERLAEVAGLRAERGRVPVSWNECADWLDAGGVVWCEVDKRPTINPAERFRAGRTLPLSNYRLLPPPGLVAAPSGMDGGGWLGAGADVPEGWEFRYLLSGSWLAGAMHVPNPRLPVQCRPPVKPAERAVVEVPLTQLVGRTVEGCDEAVDRFEGYSEGVLWFPHGGSARDLTVTNDLVRVYAEGDA